MPLLRRPNIFIFFLLVFLNIFYTAIAAEQSVPAEHPQMDKMEHDRYKTLIIARVNGKEITMVQLMQRSQKFFTNPSAEKEISPTFAARINKLALDELIIETLILQKADEENIELGPQELEKHISNIKQMFPTAEDFNNYLAKKNMTVESFEAQQEQFLKIKKLITKEVDSKISVTEEDLEKGYEVNKEMFSRPEIVEVIDVVFFLDPEQTESATKTQEIHKKIVNEFSGDPARLPIDDTYYVRKNLKLDKHAEPQLYIFAKELELGALSNVVNLDETLHIIKLTNFNPAIHKEFEEVKPYIQDELTKKFRKMRLDEWKAELKKNAEIEIVNATIE